MFNRQNVMEYFKRPVLLLIITVVWPSVFLESSKSMAQMQQQQSSDLAVGDVAKAGNDFAFNIYRELEKKNSGKNLFFSPYSITSAMSMVLLGSRGTSESQLTKGLGYGDLIGRQSEIHKGNSEIRDVIGKLGQGVTLETANRLFPEKTYQFLKEYLEKCKEYYGSEVTQLDFKNDPEGSRQKINKWVLDQTKEKIKDLIPSGAITPATSLVLANAIYFKGDWAEQFDKKATKKQDFHVNADKMVQVDMMMKKAKYRFSEDKDLKARVLELPYKGDTTSMVIVLPDEKFGLAEVEKSLDAGKLQKLEDIFFRQEVVLSVPKFKLEFGSDLVDAFKNLGVKSIFGGDADFTGMSEARDLFVSAIAHKAFVEVNEEGTEAAAATGVIMTRMALPRPPPAFRCDHPFLFFIKHKPTNVILFAGRYVNPEA